MCTVARHMSEKAIEQARTAGERAISECADAEAAARVLMAVPQRDSDDLPLASPPDSPLDWSWPQLAPACPAPGKPSCLLDLLSQFAAAALPAVI